MNSGIVTIRYTVAFVYSYGISFVINNLRAMSSLSVTIRYLNLGALWQLATPTIWRAVGPKTMWFQYLRYLMAIATRC
ncbi:MAG: hypothetical protein ACYTEX_04740 [Planctomycetota bacterium]